MRTCQGESVMIRRTSKIAQLGTIGAAVVVAILIGLASNASAYQTGFGPVQLVSMTQLSPPQCTGPDAAASIAHASAPQYPPLLLDEDVEGSSVVAFTMGLDGSVSNATVAGTSGNRLFDQAALDAVNKSRFGPAIQRCERIAGVYAVQVVFTQGEMPGIWAAASGGSGGRTLVK